MVRREEAWEARRDEESLAVPEYPTNTLQRFDGGDPRSYWLVLNMYSSEELIRFIEAAGESTNIDAKGPMEWDGAKDSAGLTKDILAFSNCRDGGVIVVGKGESEPGKFVLTGLSEQQAASFETTKVATWVNNHCSPPVALVCYRQEHQSRQFIVIAVSEFHDVPVLCTKHFDHPDKRSKPLLRKGAIYVRTPNAESAPLSSIEELRSLIGIATVKKGEQMLSMFQAMLKGRPLMEVEPDEEPFRSEREEVQAALDTELGGNASQGAWTLVCHPVHRNPSRWEETESLKRIIEKSTVRLRQEFPPMTYHVHVQGWGICDRLYESIFGLTRSGLFMAVRMFREDKTVFKNPWQPNPDIPAGQWLDFKLNFSILSEFFVFLSRFAENFEASEELVIEVTGQSLLGRQLVSMDGHIHLDPSEPCRAKSFHRRKVVSVEMLRATWEEMCAKMLFDFFELFNGPRISVDVLLKRLEQFKDRR